MNATMSTLAVLCLVFFTTAVLTQNNATELSTDGFHPDVQEASATARHLDDLGAVTQERLEQKSRLTAQLMAGEITLLEAALWFRYYYWSTDERMRTHLESIPGETFDEKICSQVISWARMASRDVGASQAEEVESRLVCELEILRERGNGQVILPEN